MPNPDTWKKAQETVFSHKALFFVKQLTVQKFDSMPMAIVYKYLGQFVDVKLNFCNISMRKIGNK